VKQSQQTWKKGEQIPEILQVAKRIPAMGADRKARGGGMRDFFLTGGGEEIKKKAKGRRNFGKDHRGTMAIKCRKGE